MKTFMKYTGCIMAVIGILGGVIALTATVADVPLRPILKYEFERHTSQFAQYKDQQDLQQFRDSYHRARTYKKNPDLSPKQKKRLDEDIKFYEKRIEEIRKRQKK